jgi:hypothetical protein
VNKREDIGKSRKLKQAPDRHSRGRTEKREQKCASLKEQTFQNFLIFTQKIKETTKGDAS